jgi:hypothetical protein
MEAKYAADKAGGVVFDSAEAEELEAMFNEAKEALAEQKQPRPRKRPGRFKGETDVG